VEFDHWSPKHVFLLVLLYIRKNEFEMRTSPEPDSSSSTVMSNVASRVFGLKFNVQLNDQI